MPRRQRRGGQVAEPRSASSSPGVAVGFKEFGELKETVQGILSRLELLERIFLFVDIEQINRVLTEYVVQPAASQKVGVDDSFANGQSDSRLVNSTRCFEKSIPEEGSESSATARSQSPVVGVPRDVLIPAAAKAVDVPVHCAENRQESTDSPASVVAAMKDTRDALLANDGLGDFRRRFGDGIASVTDEDEQKSTCSTWDLCSTRDGWDGEADIDPELFKKFMKQALRPQWETRRSYTGQSSTALPVGHDILASAAVAQTMTSTDESAAIRVHTDTLACESSELGDPS